MARASHPVQDLRPDGAFAEVRGRIQRRVLGWDIDNTFDVFMYGPGVMVVRVHGPVLSVTAVALTTPVDDRTSELRMLYYVRKPARLPFLTPVLKLVFRAAALGEVREEVRIWDHKIHRPPRAASAREGHQGTAPLVRPVLSAGSG